MQRLIHLAEKFKQPRQLRADNCMCISHHHNSCGCRHDLMRQMQTAHHNFCTRIKNCRRRLWVAPNIKFGHRRAVAESATTHQRNARNIVDQIWRNSQRQRNVRQRPGRHKPNTRVRPHRVDNEMHGIGAISWPRRFGKICAVHAAFTVNVSRMNGFSNQRSTCARMQRHIRTANVKDDAGIFCCQTQRCVTRHSRHT